MILFKSLTIGASECVSPSISFSQFQALMLDHTNHYLFAPMAIVFDDVFGISKNDLITPNMISYFHVFIAVLAGRKLQINLHKIIECKTDVLFCRSYCL